MLQDRSSPKAKYDMGLFCSARNDGTPSLRTTSGRRCRDGAKHDRQLANVFELVIRHRQVRKTARYAKTNATRFDGPTARPRPRPRLTSGRHTRSTDADLARSFLVHVEHPYHVVATDQHCDARNEAGVPITFCTTMPSSTARIGVLKVDTPGSRRKGKASRRYRKRTANQAAGR